MINYKELYYQIDNIKQTTKPFIGGELTAENIEKVYNLHLQYVELYKEYLQKIEELNNKYNSMFDEIITKIREV